MGTNQIDRPFSFPYDIIRKKLYVFYVVKVRMTYDNIIYFELLFNAQYGNHCSGIEKRIVIDEKAAGPIARHFSAITTENSYSHKNPYFSYQLSVKVFTVHCSLFTDNCS